MTRPFLLAQLSDPHIGATWGEGDPAARFAAVLDQVRRLPDGPNALLVTGDLADHAGDDEYEVVRSLLGRCDAPAYVLPGNHDERETMRAHFCLPGVGGKPLQYVIDLGALRLVVLDTKHPGHITGEVDAERLAWLEAELSGAPDQLTLLAMHHPPLSLGALAWDFPAAGRDALAEILRHHPQVRRIVAGHLHRTTVGDIAGCSVLAAPSTYTQARLDHATNEVEDTAEPPGFALHVVANGELVSYVEHTTE